MARELIIAHVIGVVGTLLVGFSLYGYFLDGSYLHPLLGNSDATLTLIIVGVVLWAAEIRLLIPTLIRMAKQQDHK